MKYPILLLKYYFIYFNKIAKEYWFWQILLIENYSIFFLTFRCKITCLSVFYCKIKYRLHETKLFSEVFSSMVSTYNCLLAGMKIDFLFFKYYEWFIPFYDEEVKSSSFAKFKRCLEENCQAHLVQGKHYTF